MTDEAKVETCPMATMCQGMMKSPGKSGSMMVWPGVFMILFGAIILLWPAVLIWLVAALFIAIGISILFFAKSVRKMSAKSSEAT